ncbi:5891_t:CDS:2, partial [Racocetra fulgida]
MGKLKKKHVQALQNTSQRAAIQKSINLVLALKDLTHNQIVYKATTDTVELIDDIIPEDDDKDLEVQTRNNSSIHIQVWLKEGIEKFV